MFYFSPAFGTPFKIEKVLGGITRNSGGNIVSAKAALATYTLKGSSTRAEDETVCGYVKSFSSYDLRLRD